MDNLVVVISGPSGSGKSTVIQEILSKKKNTAQISTYTTREPRVGEIDGRQYNFISPKEYLKLLNEKKLMACSRIEHNYYGMPLLEEKLQENNGMDLFTIGSNLREMREAKKVTQLQVVEALNVSYTHYAKIEEGIRGMSLPMLFKLMAYFDTDANSILGVSVKGVA